ncbi:hypothetical protein Tco_0424380 [Tanacetum coccineum]
MVSQKMSYIKWRLLKITLQAPFLNVQMTFEQRSSSLVLHQMTSDHNRSELGILVHSNDPSSSKLVPKVVPLAVKTATSRQELGINPMIQPEPEDLPKDNPKLEIAVLRETGSILLLSESQVGLLTLKNDNNGPNDVLHITSPAFSSFLTDTCLICHGRLISYLLTSHSEIVDIE